MELIHIKEIKSHQVKEYKDFLTPGLTLDEERFRITPNDDINSPFPTKDREDSFTLGAYIGDTIAGVVSFTRDGADREKLRHKGILFRMYVNRDFRNKGISNKLIEALIARVKLLNDIEQINLTVIADNAVANNLYEKFGFKLFGSEERAIKWKNKYFTENQMVLNLKSN